MSDRILISEDDLFRFVKLRDLSIGNESGEVIGQLNEAYQKLTAIRLTDEQVKQINTITMESLEQHRTVELTAEMINEAVWKARAESAESNLRKARLFLMKEHFESFDEPGVLIDLMGHDEKCSECQFLRETR